MRTTVTIDDHLLAAARCHARERGKMLGEIIEAALRRELSSEPPSTPIEVPIFRGGSGTRPDIDLGSNRSIREALDEGSPLEAPPGEV